ncbi:MAG: PTS sugar transporter subunit IIA [Erysipelothrix sp.]|nr:PTS sugar transporter subunit IIA [Erysipelothrix sp.]
MIGIIVIGHANFAEGIGSAVELIAGKQEAYINLTFENTMTLDNFNELIKDAIEKLDNKIGTLIFTDLKGGTPYREASSLSLQYDNVHVITGTNLAMMIEAAMMRTTVIDIENFAQNLIEVGSDQIMRFDKSSLDF